MKGICKKALKFLESNQTALFIFFTSLFILITFAGTRLFISDEGITLNQFYNLIHGSLSIEHWKINTAKGVYLLFGGHLYGKFSYSLLILSLPIYYILKSIDSLYGAHLFILQLWALSGGVMSYIIAKKRNIMYAEMAGVVSYFILVAINMYFFKPIYFPRWGELLSIEFTNILISSFLVLFVYLFFKNFFGSKLAVFASFFVIFATPISFYAITLKHHSLSLLLTVLAFYSFYKYQEKNENKFVYFAYLLAGLGVWTRILDGVVLLTALLITDTVVFKRSVKYILSILTIIVISLIPFFGFNYLILNSPFSIMEKTQSSGDPVTMLPGQDVIIFDENPKNPEASELLKKLGYTENVEIKNDLKSILLYTTFSKLENTFGIFLVSPFLAIAFAFVVSRIKQKIRLNTMDKLLGLYIVLFVYSHKDYLLTIITDSHYVLEYRYLLIMYIILLYFAFRIDEVKDLIKNRLKTIFILYVVILMIIFSYFIKEFPVPFMNTYYYASVVTSISLLILILINLLAREKRYLIALSDNLILAGIALSIALSSFFLLFYYWIVSMTFISPSQNHTILPVLENILKWMYQIIL